MYRAILVPLDGSPLSEHALPLAFAVAQRCNARLHLVHVHQWATATPIVVEGMPVVDEQLHSLGKAHERAYLERLCDRVVTDATVSTQTAVLDRSEPPDESIAHALMRYAATNEIDLIVMATHGRGGLARAWLGSVADALVRQSALPLLLVRPQDGHAPSAPPDLHHALMALDGSPLAEQIMEPILALGELFGSTYTLLRVVEPFILPGYSPVARIEGLEERANDEARREAQHYLEKVASRIAKEGRKVRTHVVFGAQPASSILEEAERHGPGIIALATHGDSGLRRMLLGSVADKVLRGATTPVLIYRPQEADA